MTMRPALVLGLSLVAACGKGDAGRNDELPAELRGNYGQRLEHAVLPTVGLEVDAHALRLGELTVTIVQGEAASGGDFHVTKAEAIWEKAPDKARECKGTVSRQGNTLLVKLFRLDGDEHCEGALEGEWKLWTRADAMPEPMIGTYGPDPRWGDPAVGLRVDAKRLGFTDGGDAVTVHEIVQWADKADEAIVRDSSFAGFKCLGLLERKDDELTVDLKPSDDAPAGASCPNGHGKRWTIDEAAIPKQKLGNGKVEIEPVGHKLTIVAKDIGLRCEQTVLRTEPHSVTGSASDDVGVIGGAILTLEHATPQGGTESCRERMRNAAKALCEREVGGPCSPDDLQVYTSEELRCPIQLAIGDPSGGGRKVALLPASLGALACWDATGIFK